MRARKRVDIPTQRKVDEARRLTPEQRLLNLLKFSDAAELKAQSDDLRVIAELVDGKPKPLFPRIV